MVILIKHLKYVYVNLFEEKETNKKEKISNKKIIT
jgi:hypothetical protein